MTDSLQRDLTERRALAFALSGMDDRERLLLIAALETCPLNEEGEPDWRAFMVNFFRLLGATERDAVSKMEAAYPVERLA